MDFTATQTAAAQPAPQAAFKNQDRFNELIEKVNSASSTEAEQLDAYVSLSNMASSGGMLGMGDANQKLYSQVVSTSAAAQKVKQLGQAYTMALSAGAQSGGASGARQAALDFFDTLGGVEQDTLFRGHINVADMSGATPFADVDSWRNAMLAGIKLDQFIESASNDPERAGGAAKGSKLAAALKLSEAKTQDASWIQRIADLLGQRDPIKDKVDLSEDAKRAVGDLKPAAPAGAQGYEVGSIASKRI
ncbi:hypothetical protein [Caulobacter segnis]|uniref:hypothetical protein n=1 Tax=Caulobacter segnis TaxID=88688 RepID=UPI002860FB54|nr:hypothetical protein [Caulobacter segnis]MDR6626862.1 hypothetical protein [Caulobacter segnis]